MRKQTKIRLALSVLIFFTFSNLVAQKWYTRTGKITFFSSAPLEDIKATNKTVTAVIEIKTGLLQFSVLMRGFEFQKALMQEHFNENYVESHKYPKATFSGSIANNTVIHYDTKGIYPIEVSGMLMLHGVTQPVKASGNIIVKEDGIQLVSELWISLEDYEIDIPTVVANKIAKKVKVNVDCLLNNPLN